jgi:hypothetical protein
MNDGIARFQFREAFDASGDELLVPAATGYSSVERPYGKAWVPHTPDKGRAEVLPGVGDVVVMTNGCVTPLTRSNHVGRIE